jgi:hypothetical protein
VRRRPACSSCSTAATSVHAKHGNTPAVQPLSVARSNGMRKVKRAAG